MSMGAGAWMLCFIGKTRAHQDLDIAVQHKDVSIVRNLLEDLGYREHSTPDRTDFNFLLADSRGRKVDVHSYAFDAQGKHQFGIAYPRESLTGTGRIGGRAVKCIAAEWAVKFHSQYEPDESDFKDISALCSRFQIVLPDAYRRFKRGRRVYSSNRR
jgi:lincosamide nucleotidyltransferase A/C/D/E